MGYSQPSTVNLIVYSYQGLLTSALSSFPKERRRADSRQTERKKMKEEADNTASKRVRRQKKGGSRKSNREGEKVQNEENRKRLYGRRVLNFVERS
jgi:hypothetical protein